MRKCKKCHIVLDDKTKICPVCGIKVKSNIVKYIVITIIIIDLIVATFLFTKIKEEYDKVQELKRIEQENLKLIDDETKMFESYLGKYKISYNKEEVSKSLSNYKIKEKIDLNKKCYTADGQDEPTQSIVDSNCLNAIQFKTIKQYKRLSNASTYQVYKIDDYNSILKIKLNSISTIKDYSKKLDQQYQIICFKHDESSNLVQTKCVDENDDLSYQNLDIKYEFKLTRIN